MNQKETGEIKKIKTKNFMYVSIMILFFLSVGIVFFYTVKFVIHNINKVFTVEKEGSIHALNISRYSLVEKKLNLPINEPKEKDTSTKEEAYQDPIVEEVATGDSLEIEEVIAPAITQKDIAINILNGARKAGVASSMSKKIESLGFSNITIGDSKTIYPITTIFTKDTAGDFVTSIEEAVKSLYPKTTTKTNDVESKYDLVIIVGKE